jgi:hypothetical protein
MRIIAFLFAVLFISLPAFGAETSTKPIPAPAPKSAVPPPPPLPPRSPSTDAPANPETDVEPEITITTRGDARHEEYRLHGRLYMIKVTPKVGKPYYLIDEEGAGQFRRSDLEPRIAVPHWIIKSW